MLKTQLQSFQEALGTLDQSITSMIEQLELARAARPTDHDALMRQLGTLFAAAGTVRDAFSRLAESAAVPVPKWTDRASLERAAADLAAQIERAANSWRLRVKDLALALQAGRVISSRTRRLIGSIDNLRLGAVAELSQLAEGAVPLAFPGPTEGSWLEWVFGLSAENLEPLLEPFRHTAPLLHQLLLDLDPADWRASPPAEPPGVIVRPTTPSPLATPEPPAPPVAPASFVPLTDNPAPTRLDDSVLPQPLSPPVHSSRMPSSAVERTPAAPPVVRVAPVASTAATVVPPPICAATSETQTKVADVIEIIACCLKKEYLRAALLASGRIFAGLAEVDPSVETLLVAHHVCVDSPEARSPSWPDWCRDPAAASEIARTAPEAARLTFLAAQNHRFKSGSAGEPFADEVRQALLNAFNDLPELRRWLDVFLEAAAVPGLWQQICLPNPANPLSQYQECRRAFSTLYESGVLHRSNKAAYIHRQDHFLSRNPTVRILNDYLKAAGPGPATPELKKQMATLLDTKPEAITQAWLASTERVSGKIKLRGGHWTELIQRAGEFLACVASAWGAAQALVCTRPTTGDVERRRQQLRELLPPARSRVQGQAWAPLFQRLTDTLLTEESGES